MNNQKYVNYYIETLTSTLSDAVVRNISLQANARVSEDVINEQAAKIEELQEISVGIKTNENSKILELEELIKNHLNTISNLNTEVSKLNSMRNDYDNVKHQVQHLENFRNELVKAREETQNVRKEFENKIQFLHNDHNTEIKLLKDKIEYLQLTPSKRKKVDEATATANKSMATIVKQDLPNLVVKDGGNF